MEKIVYKLLNFFLLLSVWILSVQTVSTSIGSLVSPPRSQPPRMMMKSFRQWNFQNRLNKLNLQKNVAQELIQFHDQNNVPAALVVIKQEFKNLVDFLQEKRLNLLVQEKEIDRIQKLTETIQTLESIIKWKTRQPRLQDMEFLLNLLEWMQKKQNL